MPESDMRFTKEPVETPAYRAEAEDVEYEEPVLEEAPVVESFQPQPAAVEAVENMLRSRSSVRSVLLKKSFSQL
ncbi:MAG: hypothetical protein ACLRL6_10195 [Clostridium sp.]